MHGLGLRAIGALRVPAPDRSGKRVSIRPALLGQPPRWAVPRADDDGALRIGIGGPGRVPSTLDEPGGASCVTAHAVAIALPVVTDRDGLLATGRLELTGGNGTFSLPATFRGEMAGLVVAARAATRRSPIPRGRYELSAHLDAKRSPGLPIGAVARSRGRRRRGGGRCP